ncbi:hypothetical protein [Streptomyces albogriseolus]|uniref:hypothetical protein n=1 Tax=Streptomyces albogriseolus TaxID=1887 RepID=UPI003F49E309
MLRSRREAEMGPAFPEIVAGAAQLLDATALDGELVVWEQGQLALSCGLSTRCCARRVCLRFDGRYSAAGVLLVWRVVAVSLGPAMTAIPSESHCEINYASHERGRSQNDLVRKSELQHGHHDGGCSDRSQSTQA